MGLETERPPSVLRAGPWLLSPNHSSCPSSSATTDPARLFSQGLATPLRSGPDTAFSDALVKEVPQPLHGPLREMQMDLTTPAFFPSPGLLFQTQGEGSIRLVICSFAVNASTEFAAAFPLFFWPLEKKKRVLNASVSKWMLAWLFRKNMHRASESQAPSAARRVCIHQRKASGFVRGVR